MPTCDLNTSSDILLSQVKYWFNTHTELHKASDSNKQLIKLLLNTTEGGQHRRLYSILEIEIA